VTEGQLSLASKMINTQAINRVVRQYIDDEIGAADAVAKLNAELGAVE
jgi:multiple sugar transport system substrate-binding protein